MKRKYLLSVAILGALSSLGYCGGCDYKDVAYKATLAQPGQSMYMLSSVSILYFMHQCVCICLLQFVSLPATNQACIEDPHVGHSCSIYHGGCSYPFHGISVCFDDQNSKWHNNTGLISLRESLHIYL